jgi:hypothetical protein
VRFGELVAADVPYSFVRLYEGRLKGGFALDTDDGVQDFSAAGNSFRDASFEVPGLFRFVDDRAAAAQVRFPVGLEAFFTHLRHGARHVGRGDDRFAAWVEEKAELGEITLQPSQANRLKVPVLRTTTYRVSSAWRWLVY